MPSVIRIFKNDKVLTEYLNRQDLLDQVELDALFGPYNLNISDKQAINTSHLLPSEVEFLDDVFVSLEQLPQSRIIRNKLTRIPTRIVFPSKKNRVDESRKEDPLGYYCYESDFYDFPYIGVVLERIVRCIATLNCNVGSLEARKYLIATVILHEVGHALLDKGFNPNASNVCNLLEESFANLIALVAAETDRDSANHTGFHHFVQQFVTTQQPPEYSFGNELFDAIPPNLYAYGNSPEIVWEAIKVYAEIGSHRERFMDKFINPHFPNTNIEKALTSDNNPQRGNLAKAIIENLIAIAQSVIVGISRSCARTAEQRNQVRRDIIRQALK